MAVTVSGTLSNSNSMVVVNGVKAAVGSGTFSAFGVPLAAGENQITAVALHPRFQDLVGTAAATIHKVNAKEAVNLAPTAFNGGPAVLLLSGSFATTWAWNEDDTHPPIAEAAVRWASIENFIIKQLKMPEGLTKALTGADGLKKPIEGWLTHGSTKEDHPLRGLIRAMNHFHDPLEPWADAGLKGGFMGMSSIYWSRKTNQHYTGDYS